MKRIIKFLTLLLLLGFVVPAQAVTKEEMDQARALAAKAYLRFANDGSGYLDQVSPKSMADLEKQLKTKEKENIKAFKSISVPAGYESWTKEQLVQFWDKSFTSGNLDPKGKRGRARAKKYISEMKVSAPAQQEPKKEEPVKEEPKQEQKPALKEEKTATAVSPLTGDSAQATLEKAEAILEGEIDAVDADPQISKVKDNSMVYVIILIVLVAAVIALVVFASNVMKKNAAAARAQGGDLPGGSQPAMTGNEEELRKKYAAAMKAKDEQISALSQQIQALTEKNASLQKNASALSAEVASLRKHLAESNAALETARKASQQAAAAQHTAPAQHSVSVQQPATSAPTEPHKGAQPQQAPLRTIYLGRVNDGGIFISADRSVRTDRSLTKGNSIYRLDTTDGYSGSFRVVEDEGVMDMCLSSPREALANGCVVANMADIEDMTKIVTDASGTAIFDEGRWKVLRKAKVHFE